MQRRWFTTTVALLSAAAVLVVCAVATPPSVDCTIHCKQWDSGRGTVLFQFVPCNLSISDLHISYADGTVLEGASAAVSSAECASSGSGVQLTVSVPTAGGSQAQLTWNYAQRDAATTCATLRTQGTDTTLTLLGFTVTGPGTPLLSWTAAAPIHRASCQQLLVADAVYSATALPQPVCYSNGGARYLLRGSTTPDAALWLEWRFASRLDGSVEWVEMRANATALNATAAGFKCVYNLGTALVQVYDSITNRWALSWTYRSTYPSCDALIAALIGGADVPPTVESAIVLLVGDQFYAWERDSSEGETTTPLSHRQIACPGVAPSASVPPVVVVSNATRPVQPFVQCLTVGAPGPCVARFGYYNPNSWPVALAPHTEQNQLVRDKIVVHSPLPSIFLPGIHNDTLRVEYPCNNRGLPSLSWKLRTPVPVELAALLEDDTCSRGCRSDLIYQLDECSGVWLASPTGDDDDAFNTDDRIAVMRCARTDPQNTLLPCVPGE